MLEAYGEIVEKLLRFSRKYYTKLLIKGILLFLVFGVLFLLLSLSVEYLLWLNTAGRLILLLLILVIEGFLLLRFILIPLAYLFRIRKGISEKDASLIIGKHFNQVGDKLFNLLELAEDKNKTELLLASIDQKSEELRPVPFHRAVNIKENARYIKYLLAPVIIIALIWLSGNLSSFFGSYERVVNYDVAYEPPAPFSFVVITGDLKALETEEVTVQVSTKGKVRPSEINIVINDRSYLMQQSDNVFHYTFTPPLKNAEFYFEANGYITQSYYLEAYSVPTIVDFVLSLEFPAYTKKKPEILNSTGNATFPEGTLVKWEIVGRNTENINLVIGDSLQEFSRDQQIFSLSKRVFRDMSYELATSNEHAQSYERLNYRFKVIRDNNPTISAREFMDSINPNLRYYEGETADDYQVSSLSLIYYPSDNKDEKQTLTLDNPNVNFKKFFYTFPTGLNLKEGSSYDYYFQAVDNDGLRGGKIAKSKVFSTRIMNTNELNNKNLEYQKSILNNLDNSLDNYKEQEKALKEINRDQKEKNQLSFNDQSKIKDFLNKQEKQEQMMKRFSRQLKENLENDANDDRLNELLKERLERQEMEAKKNEKLLEELKKVADKLEKEELNKRLEELAKNQKNNERNLEQLLELTKRYYVTEKAAQLSRDLEELSEFQENLSKAKKDSMSTGLQENTNKKFEEISEELDELLKDNEGLKKPLSLKVDEELKEGVKSDQQDALEELNKEQGEERASDKEDTEKSESGAQRKQKSAARKMQQMSDDLKESSSQSGSGSTITEDAEMLRQILDNLITFSFKQENLFERLEGQDLDISYFSEIVREQKELQGLFEHVDDSLFALSLRRAELSEFVNEQINEVYYNMDKSVESIVEGRIYQGVSYQQYVLTAANNLADFLANILDNMQQSMKAGSGSSGQGSDFQLPDIIKGQQELGEKMGQKPGKGSSGKQGEQNEGDQGRSNEAEQGENGERQGNKGNKESDEGEGKGKNGEQDGSGSGEGEEENLSEIYEIYKQQQKIREMLEKQLQDMIRASDKQLAQKLIQQMEDFENDLLKNGITERTINKANNIQHQLLKLENAALTQGKKQERESNTNIESYQNPITTMPESLRELRNDVEILNRQALPLHQIFQEKVKDYFNADD